MGVVTSNEFAKIKADIDRHREQMHSYKEEMEEMEGEVMTLEEQIGELESELEGMEKEALENGAAFETYFDVLVSGLNSGLDYAIERDPWTMKERWGIAEASFCCVVFARNSDYTCPDQVPTSDSVMTLAAFY